MIDERSERALAQRVAIVAVDALREMDVAPAPASAASGARPVLRVTDLSGKEVGANDVPLRTTGWMCQYPKRRPLLRPIVTDVAWRRITQPGSTA